MTIIFSVIAILSWYNPALCESLPVNCFDPSYWWKMSSGKDARDHYWKSLACPMEFPIGTRFVIEGSRWGLADGEWECLDRGGDVVVNEDGEAVLDLLVTEPIWGDKLEVKVIREFKYHHRGNHRGMYVE